MDKKAAILNISICAVIGGLISYFTDAKWLAAALWVFAALFINGSIAMHEDEQPGGFDNPEGNNTPPFTKGMGALKFWIISFGVTLLALIAGFFVQFGL